MAPLSCHDAEPLIELCAAGEADPPTLAAVGRHAEACPDCAAALDEARRLVALLDLRFREPERLELLRERVEAAPLRRRSTALPIVKRALAVAAMVLFAVGVLPRQHQRDEVGPVAVGNVRSASPGAKWAKRGGDLELSSGELWLARKDLSGPLKVTTPAGVVEVEGYDCFIAVRPGAGVEVSVRRGRVTLSNAHGRVTARHGETAEAKAATAPRKQIEALALRFGERYRPVKVAAARAAAGGPLDPARPVNFDAMAKRFALDKVLSRLKAEGFAALPGDETELRPFYRKLRDDVPTVVTADAVLHLCRAHLQETLREIEERVLFTDLKLLLQALVKEVETAAPPAQTPEWKAGRRAAVEYLAVPLAVLDPEAVAKGNRDAAESLLAAQSGKVEIAGREIDPSDFRPEGHYLRSDRLRRYHAATAWLSRVPLSAENLREPVAALLVTRALESARLPDGRTACAAWERIDAIASFFVSLSDDLGPAQYAAAAARAKADSLNWADHGSLDVLRSELAKYQAAGVRGAPIPWDDLGFRLFGRRTPPDAGVFALLSYPHIGPGTRPDAFTAGRTRDGSIIRAVPRGLDLMAVLGSGRARELLRELGDDAYRGGKNTVSYRSALAGLQREYADLDTLDWNRNLYWSWLHALRPLLVDGPAVQPFQAGPGYRTRLLNTALASWAQRRQDVALYAPPELAREMAALKLGPESRSPKVPPVFVEPLPELYARLLALSQMARDGLDSLGALDGAARARLDGLSQSLERLVAVAEQEAAGKAPSAADEAFLRGVVDQLERAAVVSDEPRLLELGQQLTAAKAAKDKKRVESLTLKALGAAGGSVRSPSLATVYRGTGDMVLQAGAGAFDVGLFLWRRPGGEVVLAAGPVLSYYEFKRPEAEAISDADWSRAVSKQGRFERPPWAASYLPK